MFVFSSVYPSSGRSRKVVLLVPAVVQSARHTAALGGWRLMMPILDEAVEEQLAAIRRVAKALSTASLSLDADLHPDGSKFNPSPNSIQLTASALRELGQRLFASSEKLTTSIETQLTDFFIYMKDKESKSILEILKPRTILPTGFSLLAQNTTTLDSSTAQQDVVAEISDENKVQNSVPLLRRLEKRKATSLLQTSLFVMMESVLSRVNATRVAVYLDNDIDAPRALCRVAHIYGPEAFPPEVSYANADTLVTVVQSGVAINFSNKPKPAHAASTLDKAKQRPFESQMLPSSYGRCGVVVPIAGFACVIVADKPIGSPQVFTPFDEHQVWSFATLCEGLFLRYPRDLFLDMPWRPSVRALRQNSLLPPISAESRKRSPGVSVVSSGNLEMSLDSLSSVPKRMVVLRAHGNATGILQNDEESSSTPQTHDGLFLDAGEYIHNIECMWRQSMHQVNTLQLELANRVCELETRKKQNITLEGEVRRLNALLLRRD